MSTTDEKKSALPDERIVADTPPARTSRSDNEELGIKETADSSAVVCPAHTTEAKILRRIDMHVIPFVSVLYLLAFLDRVNVGNAKSFHLIDDLKLKGTEFNTVLTIFFIPYILLEIPSNVLLKKLSPRIWLSICCLGFGLVTTFQGLTQNYGGIMATRFLLGVFECGMFPGCFYLISMWYKRSEAQKRYSFFFSSTSLAGAFGGLLASAIGKSKSPLLSLLHTTTNTQQWMVFAAITAGAGSSSSRVSSPLPLASSSSSRFPASPRRPSG